MACHAAFSNSAPALLSWKHARVEATPFPERHPMLSQLVPVRSSFQGLSMNATMRPRCTTFPKVGVVTSASLAESHAESKPSCCRRELLSCLALSAAALSGRAEAAAGRIAVAELTPTKGSTAKGEVTFTERRGFFGEKKVTVDVNISGLSPGPHGFHIHEFGDVTCDDGLCTGGHYNPSKQPHGAPGSKERHVGDLGNIVADKDGKVKTSLKDVVISLDGPSTIVGHSVVVHFGQDDLKSQPSGNAGGRAAYATVRLL